MDLIEDQIAWRQEAFSLFDVDWDGHIAPPSWASSCAHPVGTPRRCTSGISPHRRSSRRPSTLHASSGSRAPTSSPSLSMPALQGDAVRVLDKDGSGTVSITDFRHAFTSNGEKLETHKLDG